MRRREIGSFLFLVCVFVVFGGANVLSLGSAASWLSVAGELGIIALPLGRLMIAGNLDLSIGSIITASSMTIATVSGNFGAPDLLGVAAALALGRLVGVVNGLLVVRTNVPSFVVTLATLFGVAGLILGLSIIFAGSTSVPLRAGVATKALLGSFLGGTFQVTAL